MKGPCCRVPSVIAAVGTGSVVTGTGSVVTGPGASTTDGG